MYIGAIYFNVEGEIKHYEQILTVAGDKKVVEEMGKLAHM